MTPLFVLQCIGGQDRRAEEGEGTFMLADRGSSKRKKNYKDNSCDFLFLFFVNICLEFVYYIIVTT
jgi:hypothetical protein